MLGAWCGVVGALTLVALGRAGPPPAQGTLESVVERARQAWAGHDARGLLAGSDTVQLRIPGVAVGAAMRAGQAARLLSDHLGDAEEVELAVRELRYLDEDHAYAELERRFTVRGTTDLRREAVFLGFLRQGGAWRLREVRVTP